MPRKPKTRKQPKKQKTQKAKQAEERKKMKRLTQLMKRVTTCRIKKCKEYVEKGHMINNKIFLASGWIFEKKNGIKQAVGIDKSKRDEKKLTKYKEELRKENNNLTKCMEDYCKKETDILNKFMKAMNI
tara:strand:+ start:79 stop:465 length:387 start_codon:yes stop_codon:yes gene_type:complete